MEDKKTTPTPYRMSYMIKTAADMAQTMTSGKYLFPSPSFEECMIILDIIRDTIVKTSKEDK